MAPVFVLAVLQGGRALAGAADVADDVHVEGFRVADAWGPSRVRLGTEAVLGSTGGSSSFMGSVRWSTDVGSLDVSVPVVAFDTPGGRDVALGNLAIGGWLLATDAVAVGARARVPLGSASWTWVERAEATWPGGGLDVLVQARGEAGGTVFVGRGALGWTRTGGFDPFPRDYLKLELAGAVVRPISELFAVTGETSLAWWDASPWSLSALAALTPGDTLVRAGFVLPFLTWAGASPAVAGAGVREITLTGDVSVTF